MGKYIRECEYCGKTFESSWSHTKYCCRYHGNKARQQRQLEKKVDSVDSIESVEKNINLIPVTDNENGELLVNARDLHEGLEIGARYNDWIKRMIEYGFEENVDYVAITQKKVTAQGNETTYVDHIFKLDMAKEICMIQRSDKGRAFRKYFIECEKKLKEQQLKLTRKQELAILILEGGIKALEASKELANIEAEEIKEKARIEAEREKKILELEHEKKIREEKASRNHKISVTQVVELLGIEGLTTGILHEWFANIKNLGTYERPHNEKKRLFQPNSEFIKWVALEGYAFTGKTIKGNKISVAYSTELVERIQKQHINSLTNYVKLKTEVRPKETYNMENNESEELLWAKVIALTKHHRKAVYTLLKEAREVIMEGNKLYIIFEDNFAFAINRLNQLEVYNYIKSIVNEVYDYDFEVNILSKSQFEITA